MPYTQSFGLSRLSPLNKEEEKSDAPADDIIQDNNNNSNSSFDIDGMEYKTQSEWGMSDAEYAKHFKEDSIHDPTLDEVVVRPGVDYEENPDFEENLKKNLSKSEYQRLMSGKPDPYKKDLLHKGTYGRSDYSSAGNIIPTPTGTEILDGVQAGLGGAGMVPMFGAVPDLINSGVYGVRGAVAGMTGDIEGAKKFGGKSAASLGFAVPIIGDGAAATVKGSKLLNKFLPKSNPFSVGKDKFAKLWGGSGKSGKHMKSKWNYKTRGDKVLWGENKLGNVSRGAFNWAFRKGKDTKKSQIITSFLPSMFGQKANKEIAGTISSHLSGKAVAKNALSDKEG